MLSGFHHWSPVSCMQVACNAMQFSRVSLFYTFSVQNKIETKIRIKIAVEVQCPQLRNLL